MKPKWFYWDGKLDYLEQTEPPTYGVPDWFKFAITIGPLLLALFGFFAYFLWLAITVPVIGIGMLVIFAVLELSRRS